jgi:2-hydroxychromene-2-carboxylate isomerase
MVIVMAHVDFIFDFGSPNAYLAHQIIPGIEKRTGVKFEYIPALLGGIFKATNNQSPMVAFGGVKGKLAYEQKETERFMRRHGITKFRPNPFFPVNTLQIMRGLVAAQLDGDTLPYLNAVLHHMWEAPKKMDDPDVIRAALTESGLDAARIMARMQDPDVKARLIENTEGAVNRGAFGIPTFFLGSEMFFGKDRLRDVEEALMAGAR